MDCREFELFVHAYIDGEFDDREEGEINAHLSGCAQCRALARDQSLFREHLQAAWTYDRAPEALRARILADIERQPVANDEGITASASVASAAEPPPRGRIRRRAWEWIVGPVIASAAAAAFVVVANLDSGPSRDVPVEPSGMTTHAAPALPTSQVGYPGEKDAIVSEAVSWHQKNVPIEVVGPSERRVKTWFDGKVGFPVRLPEFEERRRDVNLLGARLSNVKEREAAYVVYEVKGSKVSVLMFDGNNGQIVEPPPAEEDRRIRFKNAGGYNVAVVEDNGVTYSITSELPREDMVQLVEAGWGTR